MKRALTMMIIGLLCFSMLSTLAPLSSATSVWTEPQQLTTGPDYDYHATILQDSSGKIWLVWGRNVPGDLWCKNSSDGGASWSEERVLASNNNRHIFGTGMLQDSTGRLWVAWASGYVGSFEIFYITSDDGGDSWSATCSLPFNIGSMTWPSLIEACGKIWITFNVEPWGNIWGTTTSDSGATWSPPEQLTSDPRFESGPDSMVDSTGRIWIVWNRRTGTSSGIDIYCKVSDDCGASWSEEVHLTDLPGQEQQSSIVEDSCGRIFVFFDVGNPAPSSGISDIWYRMTTDGGNTWSDYKPLIADGYNDQVPCAASVDHEVWVIWTSLDRTQPGNIWVTKTACKVSATVDIDPDTLNVKSNGQWITAYIELPTGYDVADIDLAKVVLTQSDTYQDYAVTDTQYGFVTDPNAYLMDHDGDEIMERMVKFDRIALCTYLGTADLDGGDKFYDVPLTVAGQLIDGTPFEGSDTIAVIRK